MGQGKDCMSSRSRSGCPSPCPPTRRCYMPEPHPCPDPCVEQCLRKLEEKRCHRRTRRPPHRYFNITHTSCITALRCCLDRLQNPPARKKMRKSSRRSGNAEKLICSLKNDIQTISKYEQDAMNCPDKPPSSDPFFVLSAMMCKINKLESLVMAEAQCCHTGHRIRKRREILNTSKDIRQSLLTQIACDEKMLKEKRHRLCELMKSLECFEKELCCMKQVKETRCFPKKSVSTCAKICIEKKIPCPCPCPPDPCPPVRKVSSRCCASTNTATKPNYEITGMNVTYTKSHVCCDPKQGPMENIKSRLCCILNKDADCNVKIMKDGCDMPCDNPEFKKKVNCMSKVWFESAKQLIEAFSECPT